MSNINIIEEVQNALSIHNVEQSTLQKVPSLVSRAIRRLKRKDLLPVRSWEFTSIDHKEEKRDNKGEVLYNYYRLPDDFRKLDELYVGDGEVPYAWTPHSNYINTISKFRSGSLRSTADTPSDGEQRLDKFYPYRKLFTIDETNFSDIDNNQKIILLYPFPKDETYIKITYHVSGSDLSYMSEEHIEAVIREVESILGLRSPQDSEDETLEVIDEWRERQGHNSLNKTYHRTKASFFGRWNNRHHRYKTRR